MVILNTFLNTCQPKRIFQQPEFFLRLSHINHKQGGQLRGQFLKFLHQVLFFIIA